MQKILPNVQSLRVVQARVQAVESEFVGEDGSLSDEQRLDRWNGLLQRVRKHFEDGELEASQYELLTKLIQEELPERASAEDR